VSAATLRRQLGLRTATALVVGEVIGVGIFLTPAGMAKSLGSPALVLLVWLLMGAMALCGALCYGEPAARYPEAGGGYVYLREAYGAPMAFLYGWMALLVLDPGLTAALAVGLADYVGYGLTPPLSAFRHRKAATASRAGTCVDGCVPHMRRPRHVRTL
jgi:basic amino acid/polyamine antiporter, APA family